MTEAGDLEANEEEASIEEEVVAFPHAGIVVGLEVHSLGHREDCGSCHFILSLMKLLILSFINLIILSGSIEFYMLKPYYTPLKI